jgi:hypothetical protein
MSSVLEYELKAYERPSRRESDIDQLLASLQFFATGQKSGIETARQTEEFFKKVSNFLGQHDYYPITVRSMIEVIAELIRYQTDAGLASSENLKRFTAEECKQCLEDIWAQFKKRTQLEERETRLIALSRHLRGVENEEVLWQKNKPVTTLDEYCQELMNFAQRAEALTKITDMLNVQPFVTQSNSSRTGNPKGDSKASTGNPQVNALEDTVPPNKGTGKGEEAHDCRICGRRNHIDKSCSFKGSNHPLGQVTQRETFPRVYRPDPTTEGGEGKRGRNVG